MRLPLCTLLLAALTPAWAEVKLPKLISDNMVIQRDADVPVWGTANPNEAVTVSFAGQDVKVVTGLDGKWKALLRPVAAGGPYTMKVSGTNTINIANVAVGEVWVASGQSNMAFQLSTAMDAQTEIANSDEPSLRMFTVAQATSAKPNTDVTGKWEVSSPQTSPKFSAVGYFFARKMIEKLHVPVGIINSSVNGTPAEAWTSKEGLDTDPELKSMSDKQLAEFTTLAAAQKKYAEDMQAWEDKYGVRDSGDNGTAAKWADPNARVDDWAPLWMPSFSTRTPIRSGGVLWLRKEVDIPPSLAGKTVRVTTGILAEYDSFYFNGVLVGSGGTKAPSYTALSRVYDVPANLVKAGRNVIAIRVFFHTRFSGAWGSMGSLTLTGTGVSINLQDWWQCKTETELPPQTAEMEDSLPQVPVSSATLVSTMLYNGMIAPLTPYGIRGVIWYQGEQNATRGKQYRTLFPALIQDWRKQWGRGDFPFYFVQLANYLGPLPEPGESDWAELREAQSMALKLPNTGMAMAMDLGLANNVHPTNKQDIGWRLAVNALARLFGSDTDPSGPMFESMRIEGDTVRVWFRYAQGLMTTDGEKPKWFALAGQDRKFYWADATIDGDSVVLRTPKAPLPVAVRYGWADNPNGVNLINRAWLPTAPFRTDDWPRF